MLTALRKNVDVLSILKQKASEVFGAFCVRRKEDIKDLDVGFSILLANIDPLQMKKRFGKACIG